MAWSKSEGSSCDAAYLCFQQEQSRYGLILRAERFSHPWKLANVDVAVAIAVVKAGA